MNADIKIRRAVAQDVGDLAILDDIASHGLASWFWRVAPDREVSETPFEHGRQRLLATDCPFCYQNAHIAEFSGVTAGMAMGFLNDKFRPHDPNSKSDLIVGPIVELYNQCEGMWFVDGLAVYHKFRGLGIASHLMAVQFDLANKSAASEISLVVENSNQPALGLYKSLGFSTIDQRPYVAFNDQINTTHWQLMCRSLS